METTKNIWYNGKLVPWHEATTHVLTHTLHYGGGAFEGIRFYKTFRGPAIFRVEDHVDRLLYSAGLLDMSLPYTKSDIVTAIVEVVRDTGLEEGYIRPLAFYGYGKMGVNPTGSPSELIIACWPWGAYLPHESVDVKISSYIRIHPRSTKVEGKLCGHYVNGILASLEIKGTHYHEALFLDVDGHISEGVGENFFMVKNNVIYTPKLGTILSGITRNTIMKIAEQLNLKVIETDISLDQVFDADEAFFTGTAAEVTPIRSVDDHVLNAAKIGPITQNIKKIYLDIVHGNNPAFEQYLFFI